MEGEIVSLQVVKGVWELVLSWDVEKLAEVYAERELCLRYTQRGRFDRGIRRERALVGKQRGSFGRVTCRERTCNRSHEYLENGNIKVLSGQRNMAHNSGINYLLLINVNEFITRMNLSVTCIILIQTSSSEFLHWNPQKSSNFCVFAFLDFPFTVTLTYNQTKDQRSNELNG